MHTVSPDTAAEILAGDASAAIELVRAKAPETRFGKFTARRVSDSAKYIQVNRTDAVGAILTGGWTFLVDLASQTVVRAAVDPEDFDTRAAVRLGTRC